MCFFPHIRGLARLVGSCFMSLPCAWEATSSLTALLEPPFAIVVVAHSSAYWGQVGNKDICRYMCVCVCIHIYIFIL